MGSTQASGAVIAKIKSKYGKKIKYEDYRNLINSNSLSEVISYLKNNTYYKDALSQVNPDNVHRGQLELLLEQNLFYDLGALYKYETGITSYFGNFLKQNYEIKQIVRYLTFLGGGKHKDYFMEMPMYFDQYTEIDLERLSLSKNYDEFLDALKKSPYNGILKKFKPKKNENLKMPEIEDALYTYMYGEMYKVIENMTDRIEQQELRKMFDMIIDHLNFVRIIRLKGYYNQPPEEIKSHLLPFGSLKEKQINLMLNAENDDEVIKIIDTLPQGKLFSKVDYNYIGATSVMVRYKLCKNNMYHSTSPSVIAISYFFLCLIELENIINIVEGVRYKLEKEQIDKLLVYEYKK